MEYYNRSQDSMENKMNAYLQDQTDNDGILHDWHPLYLSTKVNAKDQPRFHEAMQGEDSDAWYEAMKIEYEGLENMDA